MTPMLCKIKRCFSHAMGGCLEGLLVLPFPFANFLFPASVSRHLAHPRISAHLQHWLALLLCVFLLRGIPGCGLWTPNPACPSSSTAGYIPEQRECVISCSHFTLRECFFASSMCQTDLQGRSHTLQHKRLDDTKVELWLCAEHFNPWLWLGFQLAAYPVNCNV